jgi:hypothetical protein
MKNLIILIFLSLLISCSKEYKPENKIKEDVTFLADDALEGRQTGTPGGEKASEYIKNRFEKLGLSPKGTEGFFQPFTFKPKTHPHDEVKFTENTDGTITGRNVVGFIDNKAKNTVIIGAHFDHLGYGGDGSLYRDSIKAIHNGADDNASGVAVMLNLASKLKNTNTNSNYVFIAFSGEEMGLLGSNYFVKNATIDTKAVSYMINMDMVGRLKDSALAVYGTGTSPIFKQVLKSHNNDFKLVMKESGVGPSDHTSFYLADMPVLHFFTGQHKDYHRPSDDTETLNYEGMEIISNYIFKIISDLNDNGKLSFRKTKNESEETPRYKVSMGVVPDYMFDGKGMKIDGVTEGRPAIKAGVKKGDVLVQFDGEKITDMMGYMKALSKTKAGDKKQIVVNRSGKKVKLTIQF